MKNEKIRDEKQRFSIRKFSVGAASVLIGLSFSLYSGQQASADTVDNSDKSVVASNQSEKDDSQNTANNGEEKSSTNQAQSTVTDNLDHSTVVASYEASATNDIAKSENNNAVTENKQDEKSNAETAKTENTTSEQKSESKQNTANNVVTEKTESSKKTATVSDANKATEDAKTNVAKTTTEVSNAAKNTTTETAKTATKSEDTNEAQSAALSNKTDEVAKDKTESTVKTEAISDTNNAVDVKANENSGIETNTLELNNIVKNASFLSAKSATESKVAVATEDTEDPNSVTVSDANGLIDAIQNGTATTINIANDINVETNPITAANPAPIRYAIKNKRDILIQSTAGNKFKIDFDRSYFDMTSNDYGVAFKNIDLYGRSYYGIFRSAHYYTFDNVNYTGSQLIYTDGITGTTVTFKNTVNSNSVLSYTGPLDGKTRTTQYNGGAGNQQVLQFSTGNNIVNFDPSSKVNFTTYNSNVIEIDKGSTVINVRSDSDGSNGAQVVLNPHTKNNPEQYGMTMDWIARGIASNGNTTLNIDKGANLDINLKDDSNDKYHSGALYLNSGAIINVAGNLNIVSDGQPYYRSTGIDDPVYIGGNSKIDVNGGSFTVNATNMGDYKGSVVTSAGTSTISINHHGSFQITGDGTAATGVSLVAGSTFTSTQPALFNITMPEGATAVKNGTIQFKGVKTSESGQPIGEINIVYAANGTPTVTKVTSYDEQTTIDTREAGNNAKNEINLVASGPEVDLTNVSFTKDADGNYIMSGNANTSAAAGAFVYISVNGEVHQVATTNNQTLWTIGQTGDPSSADEPYTVETGTDGKFSVNLGKLNDSDQVSIYAAKDFVSSDTDTKTVSEWMTDSYRDQLQKLVNEAPTIEAGTNYTDADANLKTDYTNAISDGNTLLQNTSATSPQLEAAIKQITDAKTALNGDSNIAVAKEALQKAVDKATNIENSYQYYNAPENLQNAYKAAVAAGNNALKETNPTLADLQKALTDITTAEGNLNGKETNKNALQAAVDNSTTVKSSNNYTNADESKKAAYDNAVTAAQAILDKTNATQTEVDQALQNLETANNNLNGDAKTEAANRAALEAAVKEAPTVRETPAFYNGTDESQKAYNDAITAGQNVLNNTNATADQVKDALDAINTAKGNLKGEATNTDALQTALTKANDAKQTGNYTNADQANQEALTNAITTGQNVLTKNNATQAEVDNAVKTINDAISGLNGNSNLEDAKKTATADIEKTLNDKTAEINKATNIDQDKKTSLINEATQAANNAKEAITAAKTTDAVTTAKDTGVQNIKKVTVPSLDNAKDQATKAVSDALAGQTELINQANNLSENEKQALIDKATAEANTAKENIEKATTNNGAAQAGQDGVEAIQKVIPTSLDDVKSQSNKAVEDALTKKLDAINSATNLTTDEKNQLSQEANNVADNAKKAIAEATTNDAAVQAGQDGVKSINKIQVPNESTVKTAAKEAVAKAAEAKNEAIDSSNLTDEEKAALKQEVTQAQTAADTAIDKATTNADVANAQEIGVNNINKIQVPSESTVKEAAKDAIAKAAEAKNKAIDASNLTNEEKTALKQEVTQAQTAADTAIDSATTNADVTNVQTTGVDNIDEIQVPNESTVKTAAKEAVAKAAEAKNQAIDSSNLTDEEKAALKDQVAKAQNDADTAIDSAATNADVTQAQEDGINNINKITVPTTSANKEKATTDLNNAVDEAKKAIDQDSNLTDDQKQAAKDQIDSDAKTAQDAINNAKTDNDVNTSVDNGKVAIDKDVANAAIDNAVAGKLKEIKDPLTTEEKQTYTDLINSEANNAKQNIANATTQEEVTTAQTNGVNEINNTEIPTTSSVKEKAITAINNALQKKTDEINNATNISSEEKSDLINQATKAADSAKNNINNSTNNIEVATAQTNGEKAISDVAVPNLSDVKKESIDLINKTLDEKKAEINNATNLSQDEKQNLVNEATKAATDAINNINNATTNDDAKSAANTGVQNIENVTILSLDDAKKNAL